MCGSTTSLCGTTTGFIIQKKISKLIRIPSGLRNMMDALGGRQVELIGLRTTRPNAGVSGAAAETYIRHYLIGAAARFTAASCVTNLAGSR